MKALALHARALGAGYLSAGGIVGAAASSPLLIILLALAIASNNFATALALGATRQIGRRGRIVGVFGLTEFTVPLVGLALGRVTATTVASYTHWVGPGLLGGLGLWLLTSAFRSGASDERVAQRLTTFRGLAGLALGLSLDNLVVGYAAGFEGYPPVAAAGLIAVTSMTCTWIGLGLGESARRHWERAARGLAGVLLVVRGWAMGTGWL